MKIKPTYVQAPGTKYTTIQLEMVGNTTVNDINKFLCSNFCESAHEVQNPQIAAFYAYIIAQMRIGIQGLKNKKDIPVQLNYGVNDNQVIITVSFISDNSFFRMMCKMLAEKCFLKNLKPAVHMLNSVYKDFVKEKGREDIEESMHWCQKHINVLVMSKMDPDKFHGNKDTIGHNALTVKFNEMYDIAQEFTTTKTNPIPISNIKIDTEHYAKFKQATGITNEILVMLLSSLNGQHVPYHFNGDDLFILKRQLNPQHKEQTIKYIKERLAFTSKQKHKHYADLTPQAKKTTNEAEFNKKQNIKKNKKELALLQVVSQTAAITNKDIQDLSNSIASLNVDTLAKAIVSTKEQLDVVVKTK